jgi:predicted metal-dependent peptidase
MQDWAGFLSLVNHITIDCQPAHTTVLVCDTQIQAVHEFVRGESPDHIQLQGGGGTDFRPVFDYIAQADLQPACLIYLTDLDGAFPQEDPGYPVLWVSNCDTRKAPFGDIVTFP